MEKRRLIQRFVQDLMKLESNGLLGDYEELEAFQYKVKMDRAGFSIKIKGRYSRGYAEPGRSYARPYSFYPETIPYPLPTRKRRNKAK